MTRLTAFCTVMVLCGACAPDVSPPTRPPSTAAGMRFSSAFLEPDTTSLATQLRSDGPFAMVLFDEADCVSCVGLVADMWDVKRWCDSTGVAYRGVVLLRTGSDVRQLVRRVRVPEPLLIDSARALASFAAYYGHPSIVLVSRSGIVLAVLDRSSGTGRVAESTANYLSEFVSFFGSIEDRP